MYSYGKRRKSNQILVTDANGRLFHTIRLTDGTWDHFIDVKGQACDRGLFTDIAAANVVSELQIIGVTNDGKLWHMIRHANGTWDHFIDVKGQAGNPGAFTSVASAYVLVTITCTGRHTCAGLPACASLMHTRSRSAISMS